MLEYLFKIFSVLYVFFVIYAIVSDARTLIIPNWISIALATEFILFAALFLTGEEFFWHLVCGFVVFGLGIALYAFGWFGGGDVKFLTAAMLWVGLESAMQFGMAVALFGMVLAIGLLGLRWVLSTWPSIFEDEGILRHPISWVRESVCPYGIAIGAAALFLAPVIFEN